MFKKMSIMVMVIAMVYTFAGQAFASSVNQGQLMIDVIVNGQKVLFPDTEPYVDQHNRTMVPVRFVSQELGATVKWNASDESVDITKGSKSIHLKIGSPIVTVNGSTVTLDTSAVMTDNRTMVPLRFISETFGSKVIWDNSSNSVQIQSPEFQQEVASGKVKLDMWGREFSTKTNPNWMVLSDIPSYFYSIPKDDSSEYGYMSNKDFWAYKFHWATKSNLDAIALKIKKYYQAVLNVNYKTINEATFQKTIDDNMVTVAPKAKEMIDASIKDYVKKVKEHHIIIEGYADPEEELVRYMPGGPIFRTHFKFQVISSDTEKRIFLDEDGILYAGTTDQYPKFKKGVWYNGYSDVDMYSNVWGDQGTSFGIMWNDNLFITGHYHYVALTHHN